MKKTLIILLISLGFTAKSQIINSIGIKTGISTANQIWYYKSINMTLKNGNIKGLYSALSIDFSKSKYFNLTTDFSYCQKGNLDKTLNTASTLPQGNGSYTNNITRFNYFIFNPFFKIKYEIFHFIPYALIGLRWDYQLSYKSDINYSPIENNFHKSIYGLTYGGGLEYKIKKIGINTEYQYHYDITKLMDTPPSSTNSGLAITNKAFIISVGVKYYFQKTN